MGSKNVITLCSRNLCILLFIYFCGCASALQNEFFTSIYKKDANLYSDISDRPLNRHARSPDSSYTVTSSSVSKEYADNNENHKPVFGNCSQYNPVVKEEQSRGTYVTKVVAVDKDPPEAGGNVTYKFIVATMERRKFNIDEYTGVITTEHVFDRDEPAREKEIYITVQATDNGVPRLSDVCTIKVTIEDVNDNRPVFDKAAYNEYMSQDLPVGREVMRLSATDIDDGNNSIVTYKLEQLNPKDELIFKIDENTGVILLNQSIENRPPAYKFQMKATAFDHGDPPTDSSIDVEIVVLGSNKRAPSFYQKPTEPISRAENFSRYDEPLAILRAESNIVNQSELLFNLVVGRTEQTNKQNQFVLESKNDTAYIKLGKQLDYEAVTEYTLTVRVQNKDGLAAETIIIIKVEDVNDNIPVFTELISGSVPENEPIGTPVMQVRATDADGTPANNQVTYELEDHKDLFSIDSITGNITTKTSFDREEKSVYNVKVIAFDNSPSSLYNNGQPNKGQQTFRIEISDKNDNPPVFTQREYVAHSIPENANIHTLILEVKALDNDTASPVIYKIIDGNIDDAFKIENTTGKIRVNQVLDYEKITEYTLSVRADDGFRYDNCTVHIHIMNVNDCPPKVINFTNHTRIKEEEIPLDCIATIEAYDPDIKNRSAPQHIEYKIQEKGEYFTIDKKGCLRVIKSLDRDPPSAPERQVIILLLDDDGSMNGLSTSFVYTVYLDDINDNAPILDMAQPVVYYENESPGKITNLTAKDIDSDENGPPFTYKIAEDADIDIKHKFNIIGNDLIAMVIFDREEQKYYDVPVSISDSGIPKQTAVSILRVVIGDRNDNEMASGNSSIFVYNYKGETKNVEIGRVYVDDPDDWDLPDKYFQWHSDRHNLFDLNQDTGMITLLEGAKNGSYLLHFIVTEESNLITKHQVEAMVNITIKLLPEEAVDKSGSIRFVGVRAEEFVEVLPGESMSKKDMLTDEVSRIFNISKDNVDLFTVLHSSVSKNDSLLDIRFSAHGSPYYSPEKINKAVMEQQTELERKLNAEMLMINIDECIIEKAHCENSCVNILRKDNIPYSVFTNKTSFVGVRAEVQPICECLLPAPKVCLNGGKLLPNNSCQCAQDNMGPNCEIKSIAFHSDGWAMYPPLDSCTNMTISLDVRSHQKRGLIMYLGPVFYNPLLPISDFLALQLENGYPILFVDYGSGVVEVKHKYIKVNDGKTHKIEIILNNSTIEMVVDECRTSICYASENPVGKNQFLNVNSPLHLGGSSVPLSELTKMFNWSKTPTDVGFSGCISNLVINNQKTYNLGEPSLSVHASPSCSEALGSAGASISINSNFLVALLVCIAILLILLLAVVVHRRRQDPYNDKDMDDIRENIINYEDEGGGEVDANYDLHVFPKLRDNLIPLNKTIDKVGSHDDVPDICGFLDTKKEACDNDHDMSPLDDVRHYAYEGDGNTSGSLSSLASCTDEGDLKFNYLSNFGPRFRKLADMYGEDPSDDDSQEGGEESWC